MQDDFKLSDCYCFGYKTILFQGWSKTPQAYQNRIAFISVMLTGMLFYWHWEAMIISYLAVRKVVLPYKSFEQLLSTSSDKVSFLIAHNIVYNTFLISKELVFLADKFFKLFVLFKFRL